MSYWKYSHLDRYNLSRILYISFGLQTILLKEDTVNIVLMWNLILAWHLDTFAFDNCKLYLTKCILLGMELDIALKMESSLVYRLDMPSICW